MKKWFLRVSIIVVLLGSMFGFLYTNWEKPEEALSRGLTALISLDEAVAKDYFESRDFQNLWAIVDFRDTRFQELFAQSFDLRVVSMESEGSTYRINASIANRDVNYAYEAIKEESDTFALVVVEKYEELFFELQRAPYIYFNVTIVVERKGLQYVIVSDSRWLDALLGGWLTQM